MNILVISGFLGAGKTTFIKALASHTKKEFVILENEYGEVGIDGDLFEEEKKESIINIWELTEGCVCCSTQEDFASSILTIANTIDPEYLVVEPTGVGQLSRIIQRIQKIEYERIHLLAPITIVDWRLYHKHVRDYREIYEDQIASASTILNSHSETISSEEEEELCQKIRLLNSKAQIITGHYSKCEKEWWSNLLCRSFDGNLIKTSDAELEGLENLGLTQIRLASEVDLILFLEHVIRGVFGKIVRGKGILQIGQNHLRFDVMDTNYTITGIEEQSNSKAVFIGEHLRRNEIRKVLQKHMMFRTMGWTKD